jgi:uncharacterized 2Fe-2S/4Fe-4S cluster protein (DUF4445 family)
MSDLIIGEASGSPIRPIADTPTKREDVRSDVGLAIDLGTTTLAISAYELDGGKKIGTLTQRNPQCAFGADLISRISASSEHLHELSDAVRASLGKMAASLCGTAAVKRAVIAGNAVMCALLLGEDPHYLSNAHAELKSHAATRISGGANCRAAIGIYADEAVIFPHISAFVGGDITAGLIALFPAPPKSPALLCDLGTNGEVALISDDGVLCTSAAAGPAFEGGGIECGMEYADGAISHVRENGGITIETVGKKAPKGICGSGICDAIAIMLTRGIIKSDGSFADDLPPEYASRVRGQKFYLTGNVYVSQQDVRAFQLARAAIKCAIDAVCEKTKPMTIFVAGGFGSGVDPDSLKALGILPPDAHTLAAGNSALAGAARLLFDPQLINCAEQTASRAKTLPLALCETFGADFISKINF